MQLIPRRMPAVAILPWDIRPTSNLRTVIHNGSNHYADQRVDSNSMQAKSIFHALV